MKSRWIQTIVLSVMAFALILGAGNLEIHAKTETLLSDQPVAMAAGGEVKQTESGETEDIADETAEMTETETLEAETEETVESQEETEENEYADLAIAQVSNYVNVRSLPNTDSDIVGKIYNGAVAQVLSVTGEDHDWFQIVSGNVEGYIKAA